MEVFMNTIFTILGFIALGYVGIEVATAIYIYRNRRTLLPRFFAVLRTGLGVSDVNMSLRNHDARAAERFDKIDRRLNYLCNHTKFEREQLRKLGILEYPTPTAPRSVNPELTQINPFVRR
jgi:hypothetical protein